MAPDHRGARGRLRTLLFQLVAARPATAAVRRHGVLHPDAIGRIYLPADGRRVDEPAVEERHDGRSFQQRERIVHAGDAPCRERILGEPTDAVLL